MTAVVAILVGLLVIAALIYGAISQFQRQQTLLRGRRAEQEATGEAERLRALHAAREAAARADGSE